MLYDIAIVFAVHHCHRGHAKRFPDSDMLYISANLIQVHRCLMKRKAQTAASQPDTSLLLRAVCLMKRLIE